MDADGDSALCGRCGRDGADLGDEAVSKAKHTKGAWTFDGDSDSSGCRGVYVLADEGGIAADICFTSGLNDDDEDCANARLIAAAPDLLAVCEAFIEVYGDTLHVGHAKSFDVAAAVKKALGEE